MAEVRRADRVSERLLQELAWLITREARDPRITKVVVSRVQMPDDLRSARVYVRLLEGGDEEPKRREALVGLSKASPMLRRVSASRMGLRYAPELRFYYDEGLDAQNRIDELLEEVKREQTG